ncbi:SDR family oxidoreductase [Parabacteroides distasonis]|nr:SDR family oxidoreductase [Parabacteroides distasonis]
MYNPFSLENKVIIVTGASSGIGAQCAIDCSKMGARVVLVARNEERLKQTLEQCEEPSRHMILPLDLSSSDGLKEAIKDVVAIVGKINGVVNCAGMSSVTPLKLVTDELLDHFFRTNVYSAINLSKEVTRVGNYDKEHGCSIIFFASIMGLCGEKCKTMYSATKGALIAAARSMACELAKNKVRVNVVSPGAIETPINAKLPHMADSELRKELEDKHLLGLGECSDISNACIYLLSDASKWVTGQNFIIDGGYTAK